MSKESGPIGPGFGLPWGILDFRMQISDLKTQNLTVKNAYTSICNLQSAIINHTETGPKDQVFDVAQAVSALYQRTKNDQTGIRL